MNRNPSAIILHNNNNNNNDFDLWDKKGSLQVKRPDQVLLNKKRKSCHIVDFAALADHGVKMKASEKLEKYQDLVRDMKKQ